MKISQRGFELLRRHEIMTDGQTNRRTDKVITTGLCRLRLAGPLKFVKSYSITALPEIFPGHLVRRRLPFYSEQKKVSVILHLF